MSPWTKEKQEAGPRVTIDWVRGLTPLKLQFSWQRAFCCHFPRCRLSSGRDRQAYVLAIISDSPQPLLCVQYVPRCAALRAARVLS